MDNMKATFDPLRQVVIKCEAFLHHGGSGWIMSRLAVEKFIE
jgi:UDP:flavonoid glycosyltransferase YjiC (YdhE family)